jgi:hypothetical protein
MAQHTENVKFRLFRMPCCGQQLCWVNPRLPSHCPECGTSIFSRLRFESEHTLLCDEQAQLKFHQ